MRRKKPGPGLKSKSDRYSKGRDPTNTIDEQKSHRGGNGGCLHIRWCGWVSHSATTKEWGESNKRLVVMLWKNERGDWNYPDGEGMRGKFGEESDELKEEAIQEELMNSTPDVKRVEEWSWGITKASRCSTLAIWAIRKKTNNNEMTFSSSSQNSIKNGRATTSWF